jgi:hypothetical protein
MLIVTSEPYSAYVIAVMQEWAEAEMREWLATGEERSSATRDCITAR